MIDADACLRRWLAWQNFPDQGYDWRTPLTASANDVPELLKELHNLRATNLQLATENSRLRGEVNALRDAAERGVEVVPGEPLPPCPGCAAPDPMLTWHYGDCEWMLAMKADKA